MLLHGLLLHGLLLHAQLLQRPSGLQIAGEKPIDSGPGILGHLSIDAVEVMPAGRVLIDLVFELLAFGLFAYVVRRGAERGVSRGLVTHARHQVAGRHAGVGYGADQEGEAEACARRHVGKIDGVGPPAAGADNDAACIGPRIGIGAAQAAEERRRAIGAADQRLGERKGERASERRDERRVGERRWLAS